MESTITPEQIDTSSHFWNAFGNMETEISASWIVLFCQERGQGWASFTKAELETFYHEKGRPESFQFNGLLRTDGHYLRIEGDTYSVTPTFVHACYSAAPANVA